LSIIIFLFLNINFWIFWNKNDSFAEISSDEGKISEDQSERLG